MLKKRVRVHIEGRNYALITEEDSRYVNQIADEVREHIRRTAKGPTQLDTRDCAMLAALDFCDERNKANKRAQELIEKADMIIQQTNELNKQCVEYKEKLAEAINENTRLSKRAKELEEQIKSLEKENGILKKSIKAAEENADNKAQNKAEASENKSKEIPKEYVPMRQYSLFENDKKDKK